MLAPLRLALKRKGSVAICQKSKFRRSPRPKLQTVLELRFKGDFCHNTMELGPALKSALGGQLPKHWFYGSCGLRRTYGVLEIYVLIGVWNACEDLSNLAHFEHIL